MRRTRSEHGEVDRPICSARSVIEMRPWRCRMSRILRSVRSRSVISLLGAPVGGWWQLKTLRSGSTSVEFTGGQFITLTPFLLSWSFAMKVIVLGGGVIGVTTAYYLARNGAEVTLIDRQGGPAQETSFANAGQVSPG